jgi:hypothetical protein
MEKTQLYCQLQYDLVEKRHRNVDIKGRGEQSHHVTVTWLLYCGSDIVMWVAIHVDEWSHTVVTCPVEVRELEWGHTLDFNVKCQIGLSSVRFPNVVCNIKK